MMTTAATDSCHQSVRLSTGPLWLQAAVADIEQRMQILATQQPEKENSDSFAERAENYYQKRPHLLSLLHDLHKSYLHLAERYTQSILPKHHHHHHHHPIRSLSISSDFEYSDAESSISFQPPPANNSIPDLITTALVVARVEKDVLTELCAASDNWERWARKVELQKNLVELLESERTVLLAENSRLAFRAVAAEEEVEAAAEEAGNARKRASELAVCVLRMREESGPGRRMEALRNQVVALQKRNGEWYEAMLKREREEGEVRMEVERLREENRRLRNKNLSDAVEKSVGRRRGWWWWERVRRNKGGGGCCL